MGTGTRRVLRRAPKGPAGICGEIRPLPRPQPRLPSTSPADDLPPPPPIRRAGAETASSLRNIIATGGENRPRPRTDRVQFRGRSWRDPTTKLGASHGESVASRHGRRGAAGDG